MEQNIRRCQAPVSSERLLDLRDGVYADDLVIAAVAWLDLFSWLSGNPSTKEEIADSLGLAERPLDVLLTLLTALGLVERRDSVFTTTEVSEEFLVSEHHNCLGPFFASQKDRPSCLELYEVLKTDEPAGWSSQKGGKGWESLMGEDLFASATRTSWTSRADREYMLALS